MSELETGRRGFLKCMTWAGTGLVWTMAGGVPAALGLEAAAATQAGHTLQLRPGQRQPHRLLQAVQS